MDDNISQVIYMVACTFLFAMALTCAIFSYNVLFDRAENYFSSMSLSGLKGDATGILSEDAIKREVKFDEIFFSIVGLPLYSNSKDNKEATVVIQTNKVYEYTGYIDEVTNHRMIKINNKMSPYDLSVKNDVNNLLKDLSVYCFGINPSGYTSNDILNDVSAECENMTFSVEYTDDEIRYIKN